MGNIIGTGNACAAELVCVSGVLGGGHGSCSCRDVWGKKEKEKGKMEKGKGQKGLLIFLFLHFFSPHHPFPSTVIHVHPISSHPISSMSALAFLKCQPRMTNDSDCFILAMEPFHGVFDRPIESRARMCPSTPLSMMDHRSLIEEQVRASGTTEVRFDTACLLALLAADYVIIFGDCSCQYGDDKARKNMTF